MTTSKESFSHIFARALLCLALFAGVLGQNFWHLTDEAAAQSSLGLMWAGGDASDNANNGPSAGTAVHSADHDCHLLSSLQPLAVIRPARDVLADGVPDSRRCAGVRRPDEPPRR